MNCVNHPDRPQAYKTKPLCKSCYNYQCANLTKEKNQRRNATPAAKERKHRWLKKQYPDWTKDQHRYRRYGITKADYEAMLAKQGNRCKVCLCLFKEKRPHIDHDHKTGKVRALLCGLCNSALGMVGDSEFKLARLLAYLRWAGSISPAALEPWALADFVDLREANFLPSNGESPSSSEQS